MGPALARRQFRILYRNFLLRIVDLDLLPAHGDPSRLLAQAGALLAAVSFVLAMIIVPPYSRATAEQIVRLSWGDQEFLISTTIAVVGLFAVLAWDSVFPDRRDSLVLGNLPIRPRTVFLAKLAATGTGLAVSLLAVNIATGFSYPLVSGGLRTLLAYWAVILSAGLFAFCTLLALQGMAALLLSYRSFLKVSNMLQVTAFFTVLAAYFLTPGPSEMELTPGSPLPATATRLPSFWFLGMFQRWNGSANRLFDPLGERGLIALTVSFTLAAVSYLLSYYRNMRRIIEEPDIAPRDRARAPARWRRQLAARIGGQSPVQKAVLLFVARTMMRSRQHRNLLAAFGGLALAISLAFAKGMLYGNSRMYALAQRYGFRPPRWDEPNVPMLTSGFVLLFLAVIGTRAAFRIPATLSANWLLRITAVHSPKAYFHAVRRSVFLLAALPVLIVASLFYVTVWSGLESWGYAMALWMVARVVVDYALTGFNAAPFACSYAPGSSNLRMKLPVYGSAFLFAVDAGAYIEHATFESAARTVLLGVFLAGLAIHARRKWRAFAAGPFEELRFDAEYSAELAPLQLGNDAGYGRFYRYLDVINAPPEPSLRQRAGSFLRKAAIVTACLCAAGFVYEHLAGLRHPLPPRVGLAVDVGGRTLNYFCLGAGSPVVIFETGRGGPGIEWTRFQKDAATHTKACWYDRAGYGWSDPAPFPHPASAIAGDLHRLLANARIPPPYVLVGFSFGGLTSRVFAHLYPAEVAGMVLVDATVKAGDGPVEPPGGGYLPYFPGLIPAIARLAAPIGLIRLAMPPGQITPFEPRTMVESTKEMDYESMLESLEVRDLGDLPLIVLTAGRHRITPPDNPVDARREQAWEPTWIEAQRKLALLSTRGQQRVFPEASHNLLRDRPQDVMEAVRDVVGEVRREKQTAVRPVP
jgi:pimeloyl-ACP methyl ester carboxylesterase